MRKMKVAAEIRPARSGALLVAAKSRAG